MAKIGSPLFILRENCARDLMSVLEKLAAIGYDGVEFLGFFGHRPGEIRKRLDALGLDAVGDHVGFDAFAQDPAQVIEDHAALGCSYITIGAPSADGLPGGPRYNATLETMHRIGEQVQAAGMQLLFHNHANELRQKHQGKPVLDHLIDDTRPDCLCLEPDLGWMHIAGAEPAHYLKKYARRCPVIHFKDYIPSDIEQAYLTLTNTDHATENTFMFRPIGYGVMSSARLYALSLACAPAWYIMDHDCAYERDIYADLSLSLAYFKNLAAFGAVV